MTDTVARRARRMAPETAMHCPESGCEGALRRRRSKYGFFYGCDQYFGTGCPGGIGCHANGKPLGIPATQDVRALRKRAHDAFDPIWNTGTMRRSKAYAWLSKRMGMKEIHMGNLNGEECLRVIRICKGAIQ